MSQKRLFLVNKKDYCQADQNPVPFLGQARIFCGKCQKMALQRFACILDYIFKIPMIDRMNKGCSNQMEIATTMPIRQVRTGVVFHMPICAVFINHNPGTAIAKLCHQTPVRSFNTG